ncbi:transporter substrate-binding domain-containing protein [Gluconobacter cerinus]|uniref:transporter substrate-binding domain-containing protein n=1 Tax=Gluconobacter cerinus TaxID=38307 RepID=UPI001B8C1E56|nr:transporter substrate-binding domain-containing protein [Gluconobacter cerinus]MBS1032232.1 transporter substrate-binding domain-containing protein [Gluconobacter cerinus]
MPVRATCLLIPFLLLACSPSVVAEDYPRHITIATEGTYPPWAFAKPDGSYAGYEMDLVKALCQRMNATCKIVTQDWNGLIPGLRVGQYDAIIASMGITDERSKIVSFSHPYTHAPNGFLTSGTSALTHLPRAGIPLDLTRSPQDAKAALEELNLAFAGKILGVQTGSTAAGFAEAYLPGLKVMEYSSVDQLGLELMAGRIDIAIANVTTFKTMIEGAPKGALVLTGPTFSGGILGSDTTNIAFRPDDDSLRSAFNKALTSVNSDGTNQALSEKWFGTDISIHE